jgi:hypothetical protein
VVAAVVSVLGALGMVQRNAARQKSRLGQCLAHLQQINRAVLTYSTDHQETLPAPAADAPGNLWWWYKEQVKHHLGLTGPSSEKDAVFACPDDRGYSDPVPFRSNPRFDFTSYVFNGVTLPGMPNIAGRPLTSVRSPGKTLLVMEWTAHAPLSWHHSRTGTKNTPFYCDARSVVGFVDGHVNFSRIYYDGYNAAYTRDPITGYDYQYSAD